MLKTEFYKTRLDGVNLYRTYSDSNLMIQKVGTKEIYSEAIDVENSGFTYTETDIPIEQDEDITLDDALDALTDLGVDLNEES